MALKFVPPPERRSINVLLYGPPKTGKSTAACSMPGGVLLLNTDLPNASHYPRSLDTENRIMEARFEGLQTLVDVTVGIQQEAKLLEPAADEVEAESRIVTSVAVDPIGELHRRLLEEISGRAIRPTLNQYGDVITHIERFCRALCELPVNVCFVCHEHPVKDEATGQFERLPWTGTTNPALGQKLMGMVDIVGYTGVIEQEDGSKVYAAQLINAGGRRGGSRWPLGEIRALDLAEWFSVIAENETEVPA